MKIKLVMFDMDGTLLDGRTIQIFAEKKGFKTELNSIINSNKKFYEITIEIAKLLKGMNKEELLKIFREIPLQKNVEQIIKYLKKYNIKTAIVTDSYEFVADDLRKKLSIDYVFANKLLLKNGVFNGGIKINNIKKIKDPINNEVYSICKSCIMENLCKKLNISLDEVIAVGDGIVDIGMIHKSGIGIAYNASDKVNKHANITTNNLIDILNFV